MDSTMLINLTPHPIVLQTASGERVTLPPSGTVARVSTTPGDLEELPGIPIPVAGRTVYGTVEGLPEPRPGTFFVVSAMVGAALNGSRNDVLCPGTGPQDGAIRDENGRIEAVTRLVRA